ncbi:GNAT family N-acetyltransferase [Mycoplasmatota bacterium]|nr:GNAT family N-acetyltransferase [Mycoplasmatota bacterium]
MEYKFEPMRLDYANEIASWRYIGFMKEIFMKPYFDNYNTESKEMKGPGNCDGYAVVDKDNLIGLFEYYFKAGFMEIGLALNPKFVGNGMSKDFILKGIAFGIKQYNYQKEAILLSVDKENKSAYKAYLKVGFVEYNRTEDEIEMKYFLSN